MSYILFIKIFIYQEKDKENKPKAIEILFLLFKVIAREDLGTQGTLARKQVSTQGPLIREHARHVVRGARKHVRHVGT